MYLLVISKIVGHFPNTLTADDKYFLPNCENFSQPIQIQLSKKQIIFHESFSIFLIFIWISEHFEKKNDPHKLCISENTDHERRG